MPSKNAASHNESSSSNHADIELQRVKVIVLGSHGVGKTSIIEQFVSNQFSTEHVVTKNRKCYYPSVVVNNHLYEIKITDCPMIPYFPGSSLNEWSVFRGYGLRSANAYILVFDITNDDSFYYIRSLREQIAESLNGWNEAPILVAGNKYDLIEDKHSAKRETANIVKKQWKCTYIECSAKSNWHIVALFKELMKLVDCIDHVHKPTSLRVQDALRHNRCTIV